jgi:hypothetical protein
MPEKFKKILTIAAVAAGVFLLICKIKPLRDFFLGA